MSTLSRFCRPSAVINAPKGQRPLLIPAAELQPRLGFLMNSKPNPAIQLPIELHEIARRQKLSSLADF